MSTPALSQGNDIGPLPDHFCLAPHLPGRDIHADPSDRLLRYRGRFNYSPQRHTFRQSGAQRSTI